MPTLRVILLWHQHQPFYKDLVSGEYRLPWVRLHALKDYYGMVKLLDEFPNVHQNFNLVPSLMVQIQDYVEGTAQDPFLRVLAKVLPAYGAAAKTGSIEISATPFYHPILPLVCDTNAGAVSSPGLPLPQSRFRHPEDAREQLSRGLDLHEQVFGMRPKGVWPSEGSVSEEVLAIAHSLGIQWMATDEGVLGRSSGAFFGRDNTGRLPAHLGEKLYNIHRYENGSAQMNLGFRDHTTSDLIGFLYSGMPA